MKSVRVSGLIVAMALLVLNGSAVASDKQPQPSTTIPVPRTDDWWQQRHQSMNNRVKQGNVGLLCIGDSITHGWESEGALWQKYYGKRQAVNLGISGDQTQHVLWRLENGNLEGISPKLAILMIGTNNSGGDTPENIAAGVKAIVAKLRTKLPQTKILVLAIFPRGENDQDHFRQVNMAANKLLAKQADNKCVFFLDLGPKFLRPDGTLSREIMPDLLHPNGKGYAIWAESMEPTVAKLMGR